ncbi:uncharacterized protein LOC111189742 [Astyanax mexicanus]|uniref:uncharacterized protein LOC111189742 n=1 Tax=Astyanax mexicanus TaxID=7994 RepID=UPI0020CB204E|nr:uncharacterized protein LOC111189742 [Astyanax mexicanus]
MLQEGITRSSTTLSKLASKLRKVCKSAMKRMRRDKRQRIGSTREVVMIDESKFGHKRKYNKGRSSNRNSWVFGMLRVQNQGRRPVLRIVKNRSKRHLTPILKKYVKHGSTKVSQAIPQEGAGVTSFPECLEEGLFCFPEVIRPAGVSMLVYRLSMSMVKRKHSGGRVFSVAVQGGRGTTYPYLFWWNQVRSMTSRSPVSGPGCHTPPNRSPGAPDQLCVKPLRITPRVGGRVRRGGATAPSGHRGPRTNFASNRFGSLPESAGGDSKGQDPKLFGHLVRLVEATHQVKFGVESIFKCQVPGCGKSVKRLDRHHTEVDLDIDPEILRSTLASAKYEYVLGKLAELRSSRPAIPMTTVLDIGFQPGLGVPPVPGPSSPTPESQSTPESRPGPSCQLSPASQLAPCADPEEEGDDGELCNDPRCAKLLRQYKEKLLAAEKAAQGPVACTGPCTNPECLIKDGELAKLVRLFKSSPSLKTRKKFSRRQEFAKGDNPKYEKMLIKFSSFCSGCNPSAKKKDNVATAVSHVRRFLIFVGQGKLLRGDFSFLKESSCIGNWTTMLAEDKLKSTTIKIHLINLKKFLNYLSHMPISETKLSGMDFRHLQLEIQARLKDLSVSVTTHRQKIRKQLRQNIVSKKDLREFRAEVRKLLQKKLRALQGDPNWSTLEQVFGLLSGYFISFSGHRRGVLQNMLVSEVQEADFEGTKGIIEVQSHKSASTYGHAQLSITQEEYSWFTSLLDIREGLPGGESPYFFFNRAGGPCKRLPGMFQTEWTRMGFGGIFTFKNLRTSVVHHNKDISPKKRQRIHRAMCHSEAVASKFYTAQPSAVEAAEVREFQEGPDTSPPRPSTSLHTDEPLSTVKRSRRRLFVRSSSSSSSSEMEFLEKGYRSDVSGASSESIPIQSSSQMVSLDTAPSRDPLILQSPVKPLLSTSNYHIIGQDPSPGHCYLGHPIRVHVNDVPLITSQTSPRVKLVRVDEGRHKIVTSINSSSDEDNVLSSEVIPSFTF